MKEAKDLRAKCGVRGAGFESRQLILNSVMWPKLLLQAKQKEGVPAQPTLIFGQCACCALDIEPYTKLDSDVFVDFHIFDKHRLSVFI